MISHGDGLCFKYSIWILRGTFGGLGTMSLVLSAFAMLAMRLRIGDVSFNFLHPSALGNAAGGCLRFACNLSSCLFASAECIDFLQKLRDLKQCRQPKPL